jgi:hypothetical protein
MRWDRTADSRLGSGVFVGYITRAFENAELVFRRFSDAKLDQGLWYLISPGACDYIFHILNESVPLADRLRCIRSFFALYEQLFQKRCTPHLTPRQGDDSDKISPLNSICFMWYDVIPIHGKPKDPTRREIDQTCLEVLAKTLSLTNIACQEAALHGLGHWQWYYPEQVTATIDKFLADNPASNPKISLELRRYAFAARAGGVL